MREMQFGRAVGRTFMAACVAVSLCVPTSSARADDGGGGGAAADASAAVPQVVDGGVELNAAGQAYASDQVIVVFEDGTSATRADSTLRGVESVETDAADRDGLSGALKYAVADVAEGATVQQAIDELEADPAVAFAQPNFLYRVLDDQGAQAQAAAELAPSAIEPQVVGTNDPLRYKQWYLSSVKAYSAWDYKKADDAVTVAVLDTGIQADHVDLAGRIVAPRDFVGTYTDGETVAEDDYAPDDDAGHGTHVAGIIAGEADNGYGIAGVSYNAKIMPLKVCFGYADPLYGTQYGTSSVYLIAAYEYLLQNAGADVNGDGVVGTRAQEYNVRVTNLSLGGLYSEPTNADEEAEALRDQAFINMVERAERANITTVCAAGNDGVNAKNWPSDWEPCVSVIALTSADARASFSNFGADKDIAAPGAEIFSSVSDAYYASRGGTSIRDGNDHLNYYANMDGTSMACPVVAGVAALVCAANPALTSSQVRELLYLTADKIGEASAYDESGWCEEFGRGKVDAEAAVKAALDAADGDSGADDPGTDDSGADDPGTDEPTGSDDTDPEPAEVVSDPITLSLTGVASSYAYTGSPITPVPTIKWGTTTLKDGTDFTVTYQNNTAVGTAFLFVKLQGNYEGSSVVTFRITAPVVQPSTTTTPSSGSSTATGTNASASTAKTTTTTKTTKTTTKKPSATKTSLSKVTAGKKAFTAKWKKLSSKKASGYQIRYSTAKSMKGAKAKKVAGAAKGSVTVKKLKSKKRYYVQVRTYLKSGGKTYWSGWSAKKAVKTK